MVSTTSLAQSCAAALASSRASGSSPRFMPLWRHRADEAAKALRDAVLAEIPGFSASANPQVLPGLASHGREHVDEICRLIAEGSLGDFGFVRDHARQRAEQRFPLEVSLHAYRCGHRVLSQWLRNAVTATLTSGVEQAVAAVADFAIEYTNTISVIAAAEYVARTRTLAEAEGNQRIELLTVLLSGYDEADGRVARLLKRAGYLEQRQAYCVVLAQPVNATEMEHPERAQRIIASLGDALAGTSIRLLAGVRNNLVTAILSDRRRQSGWTAPRSTLAQRVHDLLAGAGAIGAGRHQCRSPVHGLSSQGPERGGNRARFCQRRHTRAAVQCIAGAQSSGPPWRRRHPRHATAMAECADRGRPPVARLAHRHLARPWQTQT